MWKASVRCSRVLSQCSIGQLTRRSPYLFNSPARWCQDTPLSFTEMFAQAEKVTGKPSKQKSKPKPKQKPTKLKPLQIPVDDQELSIDDEQDEAPFDLKNEANRSEILADLADSESDLDAYSHPMEDLGISFRENTPDQRFEQGDQQELEYSDGEDLEQIQDDQDRALDPATQELLEKLNIANPNQSPGIVNKPNEKKKYPYVRRDCKISSLVFKNLFYLYCLLKFDSISYKVSRMWNSFAT